MATDTPPLACAKCGSNNFGLFHDLQPDDPIVCRNCRAIATYAEAQQEALERMRDLAQEREPRAK